MLAGHHGAAGQHDRGDIQPHGRHEHAGHDLVAAGHEHHAVELVGLDHVLHGIGDDLTAGQGVAHPLVALTDAIADGDGGELPGHAPRLCHAQLDKLHQLPQVVVAGHHLGVRVHHGDQRLFQVLLVQPRAVQQGTVGAALDAVDQLAAAAVFIVHTFVAYHLLSPLFAEFSPHQNGSGVPPLTSSTAYALFPQM